MQSPGKESVVESLNELFYLLSMEARFCHWKKKKEKMSDLWDINSEFRFFFLQFLVYISQLKKAEQINLSIY